MTRQIHENEDLSGQTLVGPAIESYFRACNLTDTVFVGPWAGTCYINCIRLRTDWSQADVYASYWRGPTDDVTGSKYPPDIGWLHHEPMREILRQRMLAVASQIPAGWRQKARDAVEAIREMAKDYMGCLEAAWPLASDLGITPARFEQLFKLIFQPYPGLSGRFLQMMLEIVYGDKRQERASARAEFNFDGLKFVVDAANFPSLSRPQDKYQLPPWIKQPGHPPPRNPHTTCSHRPDTPG